ncbi:sensor domain-containing protein [Methylobacterium komagatae]
MPAVKLAIVQLIATGARPSRDGLDERCADLAAVIATMQRAPGTGAAGVIALHRGRLCLALEGERDDVELAQSRITGAFEHLDVEILWQGEVSDRRLPVASIIFASGDPDAQALLEESLDRICESDSEDEATRMLDALARAAELIARRSPSISTAVGEKITAPSLAEAETAALNASFGSAVLSRDRIILRTNSSFAALFDYGPEELARRPYSDTLCVSDTDHLGRLWNAMERGETVRVDRRGCSRDGSNIWLRSTYRPCLDAAGHLLHVTEIAFEITRDKLRQLDERGQITAINRAQLVVHMTLDGTITAVNDLFTETMGYAREDIIGKNHDIFVDGGSERSDEYAQHWNHLADGGLIADEYKYISSGGQAVWLQASYNSILDMAGRPFKIVMYGSDVTAEKLQRADFGWQIAAIDKSNAVITFDMGGIILDANENFLSAFGYTRDEVVSHHHRMFVDESYSHGAEYAEFWRNLAQGRHQSGQYIRIDRGGRQVWLQATYNPIFDVEGRPFKIVKYATVVTAEKLRQAEHQGQIAAIHKAQAVASFDLDGTILDANRKFLDILGYRLGEVRGHPHAILIGPANGFGQDFWAGLAAGHHRNGEFRHVTRDGREVWFQSAYNPIFDLEGRPFKIVQYATDVTAEKLRQASIDGQLTAIHKSQGVLLLELDGAIREINDRFLVSLGYSRDEVVGRHHRMLIDPDQAGSHEYAAFWDRLGSGGFLSDRYRLIGKGGREVWVQATYNSILGLDGQPLRIVCLATDVTADVAMAEAYRDAQKQAHHDAITTLPNRVRLLSHMTAALANADNRLVVLYLDLDRFKPINDTFGHQAGDRVLSEVADRLRRSLRPDQLAARIGGDEFVVIAADLPDERIEALCQTLLDAIAAPIAHEGGDFTISASIGVAVAPTDGRTPDELLRAADTALYRSKQSGRGTYNLYAASMNERVLTYRALVDDMRRGMAAGEFALEYQPCFETRQRNVRSVEALIRWNHPTRGRLVPADIIPLAEKSGLIVPLGEWVLRTACQAAAGWAEVGVSVNVSSLQIRTGDFVQFVKQVLAETNLPAPRLELELTESALLDDVPKARAILEEFKHLGIRLAMDDFGTGYSSLSLLKMFPFDTLKIDQQFVANVGKDADGLGVVRAILALGASLGLNVIAEGVETSDQLDMLVEHGCDEVQGFHLSNPLTPAMIEQLLINQRHLLAKTPSHRLGHEPVHSIALKVNEAVAC